MTDNVFPRRGGGAARRAHAAVVWLLAAAATGACDGENAFGPNPPGGGGGGGGGGSGDGTPPAVAIQVPASGDRVHWRDSLRVEAQLTDAGGIASAELVGVVFKGDPTLGTDTVLRRYELKTVNLVELPRDTLLKRDLFPVNESDTTSTITVIVIARDSAGNVGSDSVNIQVFNGPRVTIVQPAAGSGPLRAGSSVAVRVSATDEAKVASLFVVATGVVTDTLWFPPITPALATVERDTFVVLPAGQTGTLTLQAFAVNTVGFGGESRASDFAVQASTGPDDVPPTLRLSVTARDRMELADEVEARVVARDNDGGQGLARVGITALALNASRTDTLAVHSFVGFAPARSGVVDHTFRFQPFNVDPLALPDTVLFEVHAFAVDSAGLRACAVQAVDQQLGCVDRTFGATSAVLAADVTGQQAQVLVVPGHTVRLPNGGSIADAALELDTTNAQFRLYLSNISENAVEVFNLADSTFGSPVRVGSMPWGLFVDPSADTLFVANSGGDNISMVRLGATPAELTGERVLTPEAVLYEIRYTEDNIGRIKYTVAFYGFSDRLQYIVRDSTGRLLYSTEPTGAAPDGTIRVVDRDPDPATTLDQPEIRILFDESEAINASEGVIAVANIDSAIVDPDPQGNDILTFWDHKPGFPDSTVSASLAEGLPLAVLLDSLEARSGDTTIVAKPGTWVLPKVGMSDTTFISASGDQGRVVFGEGATSPTGRAILWDAARAGVSDEVPVQDLVDNSSDRVLGVGLNQNGSMGVVRGVEAAYFFNADLRLLGMYRSDLGTGGAGAALHWAHVDPLQNDEAALAFVSSSNRSIKVVHTLHFYQVGELFIRDNIVGPLRIAPPLPTDNGGLGASCVGPDCIIAKLFGISSAGGVLMLDVRRRDVTP